MSAFVVSHDHIDALMTFAKEERMLDTLAYHANLGAKASATDIGRVLLNENERSVCTRYPDCDANNMPGKIGEKASAYVYKPFESFALIPFAKKVAWVLKACACLDYQSCETDDWSETPARRIIQAIEHKAINCLPGYEEAPWEINRERVK